MPKCPNCGQETARTEDWACQWCGYPLLSRAYKQIPKTYKQLQEESLPQQGAPVRDEPEPVVEFEPDPEPEPVTEPEAVAELAPESEPVVELEPALVAESEPMLEPATKPKSAAKSKSVAKRKPAAELEPVVEPEPEPAAIELTVDELLSAYEVEGAAADAKFANKILKVTGIANRIEIKDTLDIYYINLTGAGTNVLQSVRCVFDKRYGPELNQLTRGQTVTVQGKYDGSIIDISLRDCVLVH